MWASDPPGLIPYSPPVHVIGVEVRLGSTPLGLHAGLSRVAHLADALAIIPVAFAARAVAVLWTREIFALVPPCRVLAHALASALITS